MRYNLGEQILGIAFIYENGSINSHPPYRVITALDELIEFLSI